MKLIVHISDFGWPVLPRDLARLLGDIAEGGEAGGFDGIAVADHLWQHPIMGGPERACLEAYTTLGFLAAHSRSVRLMTLATGAHFRHPGMLAKIVSTLDVLSGGRAWLGIGAGHYEEECDGLGVPFPPLATRYELLEDALEVCTRMWAGEQGEDGAFDGHHVHAARLLNVPQAMQRPHPPILIAGDGERRTLPLVARYADACSLRPTPELPRKLDVLRRHCDAAGTDFERIERTCAFAFPADDGGPITRELIELHGFCWWNVAQYRTFHQQNGRYPVAGGAGVEAPAEQPTRR
ncbi:MAG TPA: LLM class F420-dependent oxidoreductase [Acidimicrobiales bacterium]|jgi:F420-dependent oxidoreductase-like protein|nr:LLM class F420-dependent oxidoreductase [Acidimicrobiales bacterium]